MALRHACPPISIATDYEGLVKGFKEGPEVTTSYKHAYSDVCREFWAVAHDIGVDNISIRKVQAHLDPDKIPPGHSRLG